MLAEHVHDTYISRHALIIEEVSIDILSFVYASKNHVRVMYNSCTCLINTYIHVNVMKHNMLPCDFYPHVRVWRLVMMKK